MVLQLTLSCDSDKTDSGPTLIHSTGVEHYKIPPEVVGNRKYTSMIRVLINALPKQRIEKHLHKKREKTR